jgi:microcystin-dependent protein
MLTIFNRRFEMSDPFLGEIKMVGFNFAPRGYALCAGQQMSIAQNSALFSLLGTTFGGNGQVTFGLPDYRGRSPVGMGQGPGLTFVNQGEVSGTESTSLNILQMPSHTHAVVATATATSTGALQVASTSSNPSATPSATNNVLAASGGGPGSATIWSDQIGSTPVTLANLETINTTVGVNVTVQPAGGSQPVPLRNPYLGTNFVIATEGIFPSRN